MASFIARLASDYRSFAMASGIARPASVQGLLAVASGIGRLASDDGLLAVASCLARLGERWTDKLRVLRISHQKSQILPCLTSKLSETLALRLFKVLYSISTSVSHFYII